MKQKLSKIEEISSYYLNDTDTSYVDIIQQAKKIMDNYFLWTIYYLLTSKMWKNSGKLLYKWKKSYWTFGRRNAQ